MDSEIAYPWVGEMFICTIHGAVHYLWIVKCNVALCMDSAKMNEHSTWIVKTKFALYVVQPRSCLS